jgi:hypothetical protein
MYDIELGHGVAPGAATGNFVIEPLVKSLQQNTLRQQRYALLGSTNKQTTKFNVATKVT